MNHRVIGDRQAERIVRALVHDKTIAEREDAALVVEADLDIVDLVARMAGADQVLVARPRSI